MINNDTEPSKISIMSEQLSSQHELINLQHIWAGYNNKEFILEDINLTVKEQDFIGIIGPNGGGKTTLLKVLLGLIKPTQGTVEIMGYPPHKGRKYMGYVPQIFEFDRRFPVKVEDVVKMGRLNRIFTRYHQQDQQKVIQSLEEVGILHLRHRLISELSGGQRQRVYLARALASDPHILLLDEPTANVDPQSQKEIYQLLKELNQKITIIMISHDMSAVSTYVKTVGCLNRHLHYHQDKLITSEMLEKTYQCPIDLVAHGIPHRVFQEHSCDHHHKH
jgi:zinc transport system ATP-binding protein